MARSESRLTRSTPSKCRTSECRSADRRCIDGPKSTIRWHDGSIAGAATRGVAAVPGPLPSDWSLVRRARRRPGRETVRRSAALQLRMIGDIGWAATTTRTPLAEPIEVEGFTVTEAVWSVTWTADGDGLPPQQFAEFELSMGPFPDAADQLVMPATQTYSHGEVVDWAQPTVEGEDEPEQPAPVLDLTPANDSDSDRSDDAT